MWCGTRILRLRHPLHGEMPATGAGAEATSPTSGVVQWLTSSPWIFLRLHLRVVPRIDPFKGFKYAGVQTHGHIFIATFVALHRSFDGRPPPPAKKQLSVFESYGGVWCALVTPRAKEPWGQTKRTAPGWLARRHLSPGKMLCAAGRAFALCPSRASKKRRFYLTKPRTLVLCD